MPLLYQRHAKQRRDSLKEENSGQNASQLHVPDVVAVANAQVARLTDALRRAEKEIETLRGTHPAMAETSSTAEAAPQPDETERSVLQEQLQEARGKISALQHDNQRLRDRVAELESSVPLAATTIPVPIIDRRESVQNEVDWLKEKLKELEKEVAEAFEWLRIVNAGEGVRKLKKVLLYLLV